MDDPCISDKYHVELRRRVRSRNSQRFREWVRYCTCAQRTSAIYSYLPLRLAQVDCLSAESETGGMDAYLDGLKHIRKCRSPPAQPPASGTPINLDHVGSCNLEVDIGDNRGFSSYTLRGVPIFLLESFHSLRLNGLNVEGLFRREGSTTRLRNVWPTYFGCSSVPERCTPHDICSMIKRFFRELKTPLFAHLQSKLIEIALNTEGTERVEEILATIRLLPASHLGTLAFLMRQLKFFGENHENHHMTIENLACVFAPTLFRDESIPSNKKLKGSQENLLSSLKGDNDLKKIVLIDLITNAHKIGVPVDYYIASRRPSDLGDVSKKQRMHNFPSGVSSRSSSARPYSRGSLPYLSQGSQYRKNTNSKSENSRSLEKRLSLNNANGENKMHRDRRSSSTVRGIFSSISNKLRRGVSPPSRFTSNGLPHQTETSPAKFEKSDMMNELDNEVFQNDPVLNELLENDNSSESNMCYERKSSTGESRIKGNFDATPKTHISRRESPRKHLTTNSRVKPAANMNVAATPSWMTLSPSLESPQMSTKELCSKNSSEKENSERMLKKSRILKRAPSGLQSSKPVKGHVVDSVHSFMEEYVNGVSNGDQRRRRHTAPVKAASILKRNQPNTIGTGLKAPKERIKGKRWNTVVSFPSKSHTKETVAIPTSDNVANAMSESVSSLCSSENDTTLEDRTVLDASAVLEQKGHESRQRRAKRQKRRLKEQTSKTSDENVFTDSPHEMEMKYQNSSNSEVASLGSMTGESPTSSLKNSPLLYNSDHLGCSSSMVTSVSSVEKMHDIMEPSASQDMEFPHKAHHGVANDHSALATSSQSENMHSHLPLSSLLVKKTPTSKTLVSNRSVMLPETVAIQNNTSSLLPDKHSQHLHNTATADDDFCHSDDIKRQILTSRNSDDITSGPAHCPATPHPSVMMIRSRQRGLVKQRVSQFASMEEWATPSFTRHQNSEKTPISAAVCDDSGHQTRFSRASHFESGTSKPSGPPATRALSSVGDKRSSLSIALQGTVSQRTKKFEALAKAATSSGDAGRRSQSSRSRLFSNLAGSARSKSHLKRITGERRSTLESRTILNKSLDRLACVVSGQMGKSLQEASISRISNFEIEQCYLVERSSKSGERRNADRSDQHGQVKSSNPPRNLKCVAPKLITRSSNLRAIIEL